MTVKEIFKKFADECPLDIKKGKQLYDLALTQALSDLEKLLIEALPKKIDCSVDIKKGKSNWSANSLHERYFTKNELRLYNDTIQRCQDALKKAIRGE